MTLLIAITLCLINQTPNQLDQANLHVQQQNYEAAIDIYQSILQEDPSPYPAQLGLGRALAYSGQWEQAEELFTDYVGK